MSKENIVTYTADEIRDMVARGVPRSDWTRVDAMTDADIAEAMRGDPDWEDFRDVDWSKAVAVFPIPKNAVSIRLDTDVLDFFKAGGKGYQTRINAVLRHYMQEKQKGRKPG
ncbi:MAG: BrnA antitoxin family protein [Rhizobiaceae bacterium]